ncbi:tetratricopeptide repeat protein [Sphingosinicella sp. YJ22]|uniref:YbgF trimerization domain-containing protein n=1 Tax=Sphingosinicella sp. YJ22 TaxID=1104780 RepID=UPI0014087D98|nr:tetratricopeptide repeat protein [Sphingosinicella sp. YJ22]
MRKILIAMLLLGAATPALAQPTVERRVDRLEQEMRAIQRRVFPGGAGATVDPELRPATPTRPTVDTGDALSTLNARVDAIEAQLARITGQAEENGYRMRQLEEQLNQLRTDTQTRLGRIEQTSAPAPEPTTTPATTMPTMEPIVERPSTPATQPATATDPAEAAYNAGFRLWEARNYAQAQTALTAVAERYPRSRWASWARNLAGRAYLDDGKPATAARVFLGNYQDDPRGERAADSLFFLGEALVRLDRRSEACPVYDELEQNYPNMRDFLRTRLPAARRAARCS